MWDHIKKLISGFENEVMPLGELNKQDLKLASAALLVHATLVDGEIDNSETVKLEELLCVRFELSSSDANILISSAAQHEKDAVDLYRFTRVLTRHLDQDGRQKIVEMLWEIVLADGVIHEFESNMVWRAAEILGVSSRDRIRLKKMVEGRQ